MRVEVSEVGSDFDEIIIEVELDIEDLREMRKLRHEILRREYSDSTKGLILLLYCYDKFYRIVHELLLGYIFTNPIYDREFKEKLYILRRLLRIANYLRRNTYEGTLRKVTRFIGDIIVEEMNKILEKLDWYFRLTQNAVNYSITKGCRRILNKLFLEDLDLKRLQVAFSAFGWWSTRSVLKQGLVKEERLKELAEFFMDTRQWWRERDSAHKLHQFWENVEGELHG